LVLDDDGLFLRDWSNPAPEVNVDVLDTRPLSYLSGRLSDTLVVGESRYGVPTGKGERVQRMIAYARIGEPAPIEIPSKVPLIEEMSDIERRWLRTWLEPDELLLAWLHLGRPTLVRSSIGVDQEISARFVMTPKRASLVAVGPLGDVKEVALPRTALAVGEGLRRPIVCGEVQTLSTTTNGAAFASIAEAVSCEPAERTWLVAHAQRNEASASRERTLTLLSVAATAVPEAALVSALLEDAEGAPPMKALLEDDGRLLELWHAWPFETVHGARLVAWARACDGSSDNAVLLHDHVHKARIASAAGGFDPAAIDLEYAEHLAEAERWQRATTVLEARLARLPSEALLDLVPPPEADLTAGAGGQTMRIVILDRLATTRAGGRGRDASTLAELARLAPLVPGRLVELAGAEGAVAARVRGYRTGLEERRWTETAPAPTSLFAVELEQSSIDDLLRHPLSREGHALGALQGLLAEVDVPDASALRDYCERLGHAREDATATVADVTRCLGMKPVECFVSRGDKSVGLRSYEGEAPFVLIGSEHLDEASARYLGPCEMRFALAAELAHVRFGHSRITSTDVWMGALSKTKASFDAVVGFLPGWRLLKVAEKASSLAGYYEHAQWAASRVSQLTGWRPFVKQDDTERQLGSAGDDLVAAARVMQLTADRAGLLFCGDLHAAIRATCLLGAETSDLLRDAEDSSLSQVLSAHQSLAVRVAALISFHLSEDWDSLTGTGTR